MDAGRRGRPAAVARSGGRPAPGAVRKRGRGAVAAAVRDALDGRCLLREELVDEVVGERVAAAGTRAVALRLRLLPRRRLPGAAAGKQDHVRPARTSGSKAGRRCDARGSAPRGLPPLPPHLRPGSTPKEFREWFGSRHFKTDDAQAAVRRRSALDEVDVEGHAAYVVRGDTYFPEPAEERSAAARVRRLRHGLPRARPPRAATRPRARLQPTVAGKYEGPAGVRFLLIDGIAAGLWERKKRGEAHRAARDARAR